MKVWQTLILWGAWKKNAYSCRNATYLTQSQSLEDGALWKRACSFVRAAVTNKVTNRVAQNNRSVLSRMHFWRPGVWDQGVCRALLPLKPVGILPPLFLAASGASYLWHSLARGCVTPVSAPSSHGILPARVRLRPNFPIFIRTPGHIG